MEATAERSAEVGDEERDTREAAASCWSPDEAEADMGR